jgi:hypothetical protein
MMRLGMQKEHSPSLELRGMKHFIMLVLSLAVRVSVPSFISNRKLSRMEREFLELITFDNIPSLLLNTEDDSVKVIF